MDALTLPLSNALTHPGDYELLEEIGRGAMGAIYKARQVTLNRIVAVKLILAGALASDDDVQRFRAEAEAAAGLQHPNIVAVHEVGVHEGQSYFSMDYVEGRSLAAMVREGRMPPKRAAAYVRTIAEAIHYAHQKGILHRDLKPSNILIDRSDQPRVTDFGLAKRVTDDRGLTLSGIVLGTPSYMPPEQAEGRARDVGPRSDVYSLGAVLYELLTGRPPYRAETSLQTIRQVIEAEPVAPRLLRPGIHRDLDTLCLKCLEKVPERRYASAQDLADELGRYLAGEPIQARPVSRVERLWRWCRRKPAIAALLAVVGLTLVSAAIIAPTVAARQARLRRAAEQHARQADQERTRADVADLALMIQKMRTRGARSPEDVEKRGSALREAAEKILELEKDRPTAASDVARLALLEMQVHDMAALSRPEQEKIVAAVRAGLAARLPDGTREEPAASAMFVAGAIERANRLDLAAEASAPSPTSSARAQTRRRPMWLGSCREPPGASP